MQQRQAHEGILHRVNFGSKEEYKVKKKVRYISEVSIQNKGTITIPGEGYTKLILVAVIYFL